MALNSEAPRGAPTPLPVAPLMPANALSEAAGFLGLPHATTRRYRTRDIVGLLLAHGARAMRASQPKASLRLSVKGRSGKPAVRLALARG